MTCPVCLAPLALAGRTWRCPAGHAFDRAREGYVDLLPVGHGRSGITGDTREMARARARFLGAGHYDRLVERLVARVAGHVQGRESPVVAEAGCGVGHYIGAIARSLPGARCYGLDISREALRVAARAHPGVTFAINDVRHRLTLADASCDVLLDVFAPRNAAEFRRVLRSDGLLVVVIPGDRHLAGIRDMPGLLDIEPEKRQRTLDGLAPAFHLAWEEELEWTTTLAGPSVADLLAMTPGAFHLDAGIPATDAARVTFAFRLLGLVPAGGR